jgi:hypothetical protein
MPLNENTNVKVKKKLSGGSYPEASLSRPATTSTKRIDIWKSIKNIPKNFLYLLNKFLDLLCLRFSNNKITNKNKNEKCGGMWLICGSFVLFYLLCALLLGPGALIGMIIMIISLWLLSKATKKKKEEEEKSIINNNNNNSKSYIDKFRAYILEHINGIFVTVIIFNILITLILSKYV